ncbi:cytochrome C biogenesis protein CcdA [Virgisporangium aliadipatigenens]|uniref:Cytochrome C biogenesis protein CcdA n=1 Tax=Virgisporangium aliadipatigenens TaxID=741659 RepID=A0A8J3YNU8_9ACTN|nr:cytochrome c biogenesis protein CcdA [Virgisporangium aliadipatigenens]GIJ47295.1 cytochrome C biogenesis protein CcdA [Virgisporangium aliadipatigenens]
MGESFAGVAESGPLVAAVAVAALAGLVSFLSPCILPLVPGYLSYVTGLAGADLEAGRRRGRIVAGVGLFVAGFSVVFILGSVLAATVGPIFLDHQRVLEIVIGVLIIVFGLAFAGLVPALQNEWRIHRLPAAGLFGAPVFGAVFALSWIPCVGPTLGAVLGLAATGSTPRAVVLAVAYCLGLGLPFLIFGLGFQRVLGISRAVRRNGQWVTRIGGALLVLTGLALVTGIWTVFVDWLRASIIGFDILL